MILLVQVLVTIGLAIGLGFLTAIEIGLRAERRGDEYSVLKIFLVKMAAIAGWLGVSWMFFRYCGGITGVVLFMGMSVVVMLRLLVVELKGGARFSSQVKKIS